MQKRRYLRVDHGRIPSALTIDDVNRLKPVLVLKSHCDRVREIHTIRAIELEFTIHGIMPANYTRALRG